MRISLTSLSLFAAPGLLVCSAAAAGPEDFARGSVLDTSDESVVQRLTVPDDVYEWVTRADLGDLRIFNRQQEEVPYRVRRPQGTEEHAPWQSLPLFPLPADTGPLSRDPRVEIRLNDAGSIVAYAGSDGAPISNAAFLLDGSALARPPDELRLTWAGSDADDFVGRIKVELSDDLDEWSTLVASTTIARLDHEDRSVALNQIGIPAKKARYYRITQVDGNTGLELTRVEARHRMKDVPARRWKTLSGEAVRNGFQFASGGRFPVDRLRVTGEGNANFLVTVHLYSRSSPDDSWTDRGERTFYRTAIDGITVEAEPLAIAFRDQYWRLEFQGTGLDEPLLEIGWLPDEVVFLKQGSAPYVLAYGQAGVEARMWPLAELLRQLHGGEGPVSLADVPWAHSGNAEMLGGAGRLQPAAEPMDWQTLVLWTVLVLGVLLVGGLAYRLLRGETAA